MTSYLEGYDAGGHRRDLLVRRSLIALAGLLVGVLIAYFAFRNLLERRQLDAMFTLLAAKDYPAAYKLWGCSVEQPCRHYTYQRFLEDWGPASDFADAAKVTVLKTLTCRSGMLRTVRAPNGKEENIWVEYKDKQLSFAPFPGRGECTWLP